MLVITLLYSAAKSLFRRLEVIHDIELRHTDAALQFSLQSATKSCTHLVSHLKYYGMYDVYHRAANYAKTETWQ